MSNYVFGTSLSYRDYLQAKSFERSLKGEISSSTRSIIASNEELQRENISVLRDLSSSVSSGLENISIELSDLSSGIDQLNATFQWGFSELLTQTSRINDSLDELVRLAKTPAQTWAYEQFEIARDADRKGLFEEAIEYLDRAINGYGGQTGYKLEYRFHFLLGRIRIGSFRNHSKEIVSQEDAERSFLYAARYAAQDAPKEAAHALLAAGWAAYSRGDPKNAQDYTQQAISFDPKLGEAHFQLAKILMHINKPEQALIPLQTSIDLDRHYTIKAATDGDFKPHETQVNSLFEANRRRAQEKSQELLTALDHEQTALEHQRATEFHLVKSLPLDEFSKAMEQANAAASQGTLYGYLDALEFCHEAQSQLKQASERMRVTHQQLMREELDLKQRATAVEAARLEGAKKSARTAFWVSLASTLCGPFGLAGLILGISACSQYQSLSKKDGMQFAVAAIVISVVGLTAYALFLFLVVIPANNR